MDSLSDLVHSHTLVHGIIFNYIIKNVGIHVFITMYIKRNTISGSIVSFKMVMAALNPV